MDMQEVFRELCDESHDLIQSVAPDGRFLYVNRAWRETLGYTPAEIDTLTVIDVIHPESLDHCQTVLRSVMEGRPVDEIEAVFVAKDGHRVEVQGSAKCLFDDGEPVATRAIFRDVTAGKATREELDRLFSLSLDMLCIAGTDGYLKRINPAFGRVLGYSREELLSRPFIEFVHPDDREDTLNEVQNLAEGRNTVDFRNRYLAKDGSYRWLAWRSTPLPSSGTIYAIARDITDERRNQELLARQAEELARSNADLEQFASVASHDLQAPLRSVMSLIEWIDDDLRDGRVDKAHQQLEVLRSRIERMELLTDELLQYARAGNLDEVPADIDTAELVEHVAAHFSSAVGFKIAAAPGMPTICARKTALEQVFRNLVGNSIAHHDGERGTITVSAADRGEYYEFSVTDDGPGIPPDDAEVVFEMFRRLKSERSTEGTGMGLALVQKHVERRGGKAWVEPRAGRGTTVRFTWPKRFRPSSEADG